MFDAGLLRIESPLKSCSGLSSEGRSQRFGALMSASRVMAGGWGPSGTKDFPGESDPPSSQSERVDKTLLSDILESRSGRVEKTLRVVENKT